jgi:hypothetical protein
MARFAQVHMHVEKTRADELASAFNDLRIAGLDTGLDHNDFAAFDQNVGD